MVYIKPYDESVYENFFIFIKTIQNLEVRYKITLETTVPEDLFDSYAKSHELRQKHGLTKGLSKFNKMTEDCMRQIKYIVTLGGDGTILWASK
jgi:NAD kinase